MNDHCHKAAVFRWSCWRRIAAKKNSEDMVKRGDFMEKRQSRKKAPFVKKEQDIDRSFVVIPEVIPDHWREKLDVFFDENETGMDHVRYMMDISKADVDRYYFTGGYEIRQ
jgi:hypothetical protein